MPWETLLLFNKTTSRKISSSMSFNASHPFDAKNVGRVLVKQRLISLEKIREIIQKKDEIQNKVQKTKKTQKNSERDEQFDFIDLIVQLNLMRLDESTKPLDEDAIFQALALYWRIPYAKLDPLKLDLNIVTNTLPKSFAVKHLVLPIKIEGETITVATCNPFNTEVLEDIARATGLITKPLVSPRTDIQKLLNEFFYFKRSIAAAENQFSNPQVDLGNLEQYVNLSAEDELQSNDRHVVNAVNHLFIYAFDQKASDIHIEPKRDSCYVRMRIDGTLHTVYKLPKTIHSAIVSRIKNLSRMDMAEKRRPQDGRIKTARVGGVTH